MEKKLSEAALQGDATVLHQILTQDPLILDRIIVSCLSETPLHTAAALGHLPFVNLLLSRAPALAAELDSRGCSPLHLAAAKGHADVVRELAAADSGFVRNADGRNPLHVAAAKGRVAVLAEMVRVNPEWIQALTDRDETGLHLCVKWNRTDAVRVLGEEMRSRNGDVLNWKDCEGNTALHIAITHKHLQIIEYLVTLNGLQVNALNKSGLTALDVLGQSPRGLRDMEIEHLLRKAGASNAKDLHLISNDWAPATMKKTNTRALSTKKTKKSADWLGRKRSSLMVVASLIATVAFQAGLTPPGGVWQDDYVIDEDGNAVADPHSVGHAVMAYKQPKEYGIFMICNTVAFLSSLSIILILVSGLPLTKRRWMWVQMVIMWIAITALEATYFITLTGMSPDGVGSMLREVTEKSVLAWMTVMAVVFMGNVVRLNLWVLRKYGWIKEKKRRSEGVDDDDDQEDVFD
ncbi:ankyrin repeat-containing protein BDA1-like [Salvia hispanica]|uniref:ankyrin repeat-containing protein BDA1-like n=1 Tax=Salvia hispanica TaxID=49212 RepID=UPI0020093D6C|nr:ankyrin repeat-containing protein BDA1-like [Salvia hispanica]